MAFEINQILAVWRKALIVSGQDSRILRKDVCGAWIKLSDYGNRNSEFGWEIDHVIPAANGGSDMLDNLRPLHWQNNASRSDGWLTCPVTAS